MMRSTEEEWKKGVGGLHALALHPVYREVPVSQLQFQDKAAVCGTFTKGWISMSNEEVWKDGWGDKKSEEECSRSKNCQTSSDSSLSDLCICRFLWFYIIVDLNISGLVDWSNKITHLKASVWVLGNCNQQFLTFSFSFFWRVVHDRD